MFADMVGYTALAQRDEAGAMRALGEQRKVIRPIFSKHGGREVKTMGDGSLVEFESALAAVECAAEIQKTLRRSSSGLEIPVRVGIHVGDVIHQEGDVYGDAVNIASRIEPLAEAGGICISEQVYDQIRNKVSYGLVKLEPQAMKNISFQVDVYRLELPWEERAKTMETTSDRRRVAVLPFSNISPDPKDGYFADGMTEELITVLSQVQGLRVIARTSVDHYRGKDKTVSQIGRELKVGSVMEGSVRMAGDRLRVTAQLVDAANEEHVWSENYDRKLDDVFAIQSDIARNVAEALKVKLLAKEEERLDKRGAENVSAYTAYLKGRALLAKRKRSELIEAKEMFEAAISQDPTFAQAYGGLADAYFLLGDYWALPIDVARQKAKELISKAIRLDPDLAEAHASLGVYLYNDYRYADAEAEFKRALSLNPSYSMAHMWYSFVLGTVGRHDEKLEHLRLAEELDPQSVIILANECFWLAGLGMLEEAEEKLQRATQIDPGSLFTVDTTSFYYYLIGEPAEGLSILDSYPQFHKEATIIAGYAQLHAANGDRTNALLWIKRLLEFPETTFGRDWFAAMAYAELGDLDNFFLLANQSVDRKEMRFDGHKIFRAFRKVRDDPRWSELLAKAGLTP